MERWSEDEHERFVAAVSKYGRAWSKVQELVGTKTTTQVRSHAQKWFAKLERKRLGGQPDSEGITIPPPRPKKKPALSSCQGERDACCSNYGSDHQKAGEAVGQHFKVKVEGAKTLEELITCAGSAALAATAVVVEAAPAPLRNELEAQPSMMFPFLGLTPSILTKMVKSSALPKPLGPATSEAGSPVSSHAPGPPMLDTSLARATSLGQPSLDPASSTATLLRLLSSQASVLVPHLPEPSSHLAPLQDPPSRSRLRPDQPGMQQPVRYCQRQQGPMPPQDSYALLAALQEAAPHGLPPSVFPAALQPQAPAAAHMTGMASGVLPDAAPPAGMSPLLWPLLLKQQRPPQPPPMELHHAQQHNPTPVPMLQQLLSHHPTGGPGAGWNESALASMLAQLITADGHQAGGMPAAEAPNHVPHAAHGLRWPQGAASSEAAQKHLHLGLVCQLLAGRAAPAAPAEAWGPPVDVLAQLRGAVLQGSERHQFNHQASRTAEDESSGDSEAVRKGHQTRLGAVPEQAGSRLSDRAKPAEGGSSQVTPDALLTTAQACVNYLRDYETWQQQLQHEKGAAPPVPMAIQLQQLQQRPAGPMQRTATAFVPYQPGAWPTATGSRDELPTQSSLASVLPSRPSSTQPRSSNTQEVVPHAPR